MNKFAILGGDDPKNTDPDPNDTGGGKNPPPPAIDKM